MGYLVFGEWLKIQTHILLLACRETLGKLFLCASVLSSIKCGNKSSRLLGIMRRLSWKEFAEFGTVPGTQEMLLLLLLVGESGGDCLKGEARKYGQVYKKDIFDFCGGVGG